MTWVLVVNSSAKPILINGEYIAPNGQGSFDKAVVPEAYYQYIQGGDSQKPEKADDSQDNNVVLSEIEALQLKTVAEIESELDNLDIDALQQLQQLEDQSEHPRKGVLEAISAELLKRSDEL